MMRTLEEILPQDVMDEAARINSDPAHIYINMTMVGQTLPHIFIT